MRSFSSSIFLFYKTCQTPGGLQWKHLVAISHVSGATTSQLACIRIHTVDRHVRHFSIPQDKAYISPDYRHDRVYGMCMQSPEQPRNHPCHNNFNETFYPCDIMQVHGIKHAMRNQSSLIRQSASKNKNTILPWGKGQPEPAVAASIHLPYGTWPGCCE